MQAAGLDLAGELDRPDGLVRHEHRHTELHVAPLPEVISGST
jgi:hypothetical protein